ncbi:hypothetical protein NQ176_g4417 [Zarea fungicola]|uniref:Uncharacterized protein n=1 Tax=Zarea fungicola TaxID=93591 RepID=A0ACC1NDG3_9HYPO|nr:hypothetical protein NQ176_g4417 [Lecanicillium fungicola]
MSYTHIGAPVPFNGIDKLTGGDSSTVPHKEISSCATPLPGSKPRVVASPASAGGSNKLPTSKRSNMAYAPPKSGISPHGTPLAPGDRESVTIDSD